MSSDGPVIHRPIPRRPFDLTLTSATPPSSSEQTPSTSRRGSLPSKSQTTSTTSLFATQHGGLNGNTGGLETPISRTRSILDLAGSTLFGIYSYDNDAHVGESGMNTPMYGSPNVRGSVSGVYDDADSFSRPTIRRAKSSQRVAPTPLYLRVLGLALRTGLLFVIGMAYGLLVTHFHASPRLPSFRSRTAADLGRGILADILRMISDADNLYLTLWGLAGVGVGSALPWVDGVWDEWFGGDAPAVNSKEGRKEDVESATGVGGLAARWTPVVRSVGAFVGIAFAIRKLPWASTLQLSLTLALVNPFLWYLIDRSNTGFLLSTLFSVFGSSTLIALDAHIVPSPLTVSRHGGGVNGTAFEGVGQGRAGVEDKIGNAIWVMSVLFCAVLCFGQVGRRLAILRRRAKQE